MNTTTRFLGATALLLVLAACGGGGGSSGPSPVTPPPADPTPTGTTTRELVAFVNDGGHTTELDAGVTRRTRGFIQDGQNGTVAVDRVAGTDIGLVQYRLGDDVFIYRLTGEPVASMSMPSGIYNGPLDMNYRMDGDANWAVMAGQVNLALDFETGEIAIGGMATDRNHSIELFGDAQIVDNQFTDTNTTLRLRNAGRGGTLIRDEVGTVRGMAVSHEGNQAIFGLVDAMNDDNGFRVRGGFTATLDQD